MKFRIQNKGVATGLAASALLAAHQNQTKSSEVESFVNANSIQAIDFPQITTDVEAEETDGNGDKHFIDLPSEPKWDDRARLRFEELVEKFALKGKLESHDQVEYSKLKALRSRTHSSRSFDEIVSDNELHKKVNEAVKSLNLLVEYATRTFPSEAQTNHS